uniref:Uncharacterized protein n=1 Tax=Panagrolaimus sp. ES5 TaxID=591445 RepID=A0AC34G6L3_9BILA
MNNVSFGTIPDFIGNRFNILFAIAACIFFLRDDIINFIKTIDTDLRKTPVLQWLTDPTVISHLHILAAYNAYITAPLLRLTEHAPSMDILKFCHAPNKRSAVRAIRIQGIINKTYEWYDNLNTAEKEKLLNEGLVNAPKLEKDAAAQQKAYEMARWNRILEKQREDEILTAIKARKQAEANRVLQKYGGYWATMD